MVNDSQQKNDPIQRIIGFVVGNVILLNHGDGQQSADFAKINGIANHVFGEVVTEPWLHHEIVAFECQWLPIKNLLAGFGRTQRRRDAENRGLIAVTSA